MLTPIELAMSSSDASVAANLGTVYLVTSESIHGREKTIHHGSLLASEEQPPWECFI
jgi:hypothetical protein